MRIFGAHVFPWLVEKEAPTRHPAVSRPVVSFQPPKTVPVLFTSIVGSTCQLYGDVPSVILMFGKNGTVDDADRDRAHRVGRVAERAADDCTARVAPSGGGKT